VSPLELLGSAIQEAVRQVVREELRAGAIAAPSTPVPTRQLVTVPTAAKEIGVGEDAIRELLTAGRLRDHRAALNATRRRPTPLVEVDEVRDALGQPAPARSEPVDFAASAARIRARKEKQGG
jgi:hypothetical protein